MAKSIIALNGSGRKNGNSAAILDSFLDGVRSAEGGFEIEKVDVFDLDYKGCRGCHGCELRDRKLRGCVQKDGASELLSRMRQADGIVFSAPIFFWELPAQLRALLERYIYPGMLDHHQEIAALYNMFQPEEVSKQSFTPHAATISWLIKAFLRRVNFTELIINQTKTWDKEQAKLYANYSESSEDEFEKIHESRWPKDLADARAAGAAFAERIAGR